METTTAMAMTPERTCEIGENHKISLLATRAFVKNWRRLAVWGYPAPMTKKRPKRRSSGKLRGAAVSAKQAPKHCKVGLSACMKKGGRRVAGPCMREFHRCKNK